MEILGGFATRKTNPVDFASGGYLKTPSLLAHTPPGLCRRDIGRASALVYAMAEWAAGQVGLHFIPAGEPWRNGYIESFNSRIRDECLNITSFWSLTPITSFWSLTQARVVISDWKHDYNHRHSAMGYQPPARYAATCTHQ
jgi:hypothetical protein